MYKKYLGKSLRYYRMQQSISQQELANLTGFHRTYISAVEQGTANITLDTLSRLVGGLGITFFHLLPDHTQIVEYKEDIV